MAAILKWMVPFIVDIGLKFGMPALTEWILKRFPFLPQALLDNLVALVKQAIEDMTGYHPSSPEGVAVRNLAKRETKQCIGAFCEAQLKSN